MIQPSFTSSKWNMGKILPFLGGFWPKNVGEKWSRKIYFEIPPCGKLFSLLHKIFPNGGISKIFFLDQNF